MRTTLITTVMTAASDYKLVSVADVKTELGITGTTDDTWLGNVVDRASEAAAQYCNRVFQAETVRDEFWPERDSYPFQLPGGLAPLQLSRWPVKALTLVTEGDQTLTEAASNFRLDKEMGQITRLDGSAYPTAWLPRPIKVEYSAGYDTIPFDIQDAVIRMVKSRWFLRKRDPLLKQEDVPGVHSASYWVSTGGEGAMTPDVADLLDNYRVPIAIA
ncbi:phage head-tail connector protein [Ancylobacter polymorphus]|uniref:Phage gp6-like head-tail connector protein n=1 Tax=Ancylobacter polymorphus TaxID=223390 RepID=A0ABU0BHS4_9HYPH|nr:phage head-tail connector protein [Ancylobacter polymorphus]MDQ0305331.1 hypothetical protein [Ancylobacter polymorphus]